MEANLSRFLIIAGGILLAILLLSVFVYVFSKGASVNENYDTNQSLLQVEAYNAKFQNYLKENTIDDLISLINLVYSNNVSYGYEPSFSIKLDIKDGPHTILSIPKENLYNLERNQVYVNGKNKAYSVYNLIDLPASEFVKGLVVGEKDHLTDSRICPHSNRIFYYYFEVDDIKYKNKDDRVSEMTLSIHSNSKDSCNCED